jgi:hypothetical protein
MPDLQPYSYAVIRVVPRVDRDEFVNAGVIVYAQQAKFLKARVRVPEGRVKALWPNADMAQITRHVEAIPRICEGDAAAGPVAQMSQSQRFHWLTSPRSTMIQISPVRMGLSAEPEQVLERLAGELVG